MYKSIVEGECGIVAKIVTDSVNEAGNRITTFELEYPRFIHSELMTHRLFSRNAMSSRAVPISKMIEQVRNNPAIPVHWGKNKAGMQADEELGSLHKTSAKMAWERAAYKASVEAENMANYGAHKQIVNRLLEPFQMMKTVLTATEFDNFFWLRCHEDAQPEIKVLADCMWDTLQDSEPELLKEGEWHTPYVEHFRASNGGAFLEYRLEGVGLSLEEALKLSASCCAQVSYRVLDNSLEKALKIYDKLIESKPVHASPVEHQATPVSKYHYNANDTESFFLESDLSGGLTHLDKKGYVWSGNFKGWVQNRQLIKDSTCWDYEAN